MHCRRFQNQPMSRRDLLAKGAMGFGGVALQALLAEQSRAAITNPLAPKAPHFAPKAKNVIFLYMDGGPSQVDTFDYKPMLKKYHGRDPSEVIGKLAPTQFDSVGKVLQAQWDFKQRGESGAWVSELFPHLAKKEVIDEIAFVKSMTSKFSEHTFANYFLHTGSPFQGRPSMGAWLGYGLGSENENLPGFVVLNGGLIPPGGLDCFGSGFLPASHQGSVFKPSGTGVANITPTEATAKHQRDKLALINQLDGLATEQFGRHDSLESAIKNYELAYAMQMAVPEVMSIDDEPAHLRRAYGLESQYAPTKIYGAQCLIARRMIERGVRFIELTCPKVGGDRWDQHSNLKQGHENNARAVDQRCADRQPLAVVHRQDFAQLDAGPGIAVQLFDGQNVVFRNAVLLTAGFDHCVHCLFRPSFPCSCPPDRPAKRI